MSYQSKNILIFRMKNNDYFYINNSNTYLTTRDFEVLFGLSCETIATRVLQQRKLISVSQRKVSGGEKTINPYQIIRLDDKTSFL